MNTNTLRLALSTVLTGLLLSTPAWSKPAPSVKKPTVAKKQVKSTKQTKSVKKTVVSNTPVWVEQSETVQQIARWVVPGQYDCFAGKAITLTPRADHLGYIDVQYSGKTQVFLAVTSQTGAVRLENMANDLFWLQLPSKSMLFSSRTGSRVLDDCQPLTPPPMVDTPATGLDASPPVMNTAIQPAVPVNSDAVPVPLPTVTPTDVVTPNVANPATDAVSVEKAIMPAVKMMP